ncbi:MAG: T9SS type A sorting domain-containing protein [Saprospiraceae bacterium]|nr:T9SS type A sorting domain-containing protein [Saprospiraceae bacterium]
MKSIFTISMKKDTNKFNWPLFLLIISFSLSFKYSDAQEKPYKIINPFWHMDNPQWNQSTRLEKINLLEYAFLHDSIWYYDAPERANWICSQYALQTVIDYNGYPELEHLSLIDSSFYNRFYFNNNGKFKIPVFRVYVPGHAFNTCLIGDDPYQFDDWYFFEPQRGPSLKKVEPGKCWSMSIADDVVIDNLFYFFQYTDDGITHISYNSDQFIRFDQYPIINGDTIPPYTYRKLENEDIGYLCWYHNYWDSIYRDYGYGDSAAYWMWEESELDGFSSVLMYNIIDSICKNNINVDTFLNSVDTVLINARFWSQYAYPDTGIIVLNNPLLDSIKPELNCSLVNNGFYKSPLKFEINVNDFSFLDEYGFYQVDTFQTDSFSCTRENEHYRLPSHVKTDSLELILNDGGHTINLSVSDLPGNKKDLFVNFTIDNIPPKITASITERNVLNYSFEDVNLSEFGYKLNDNQIQYLSDPNAQVTLENADQYGDNTLILFAKDLAGWETDTTIFWSFTAIDLIEPQNFKTYPNPSNTTIVIEYDQQFKYEIINLNAQIVQSKEISVNRTIINISGLPKGIYTLKMTTKEGIIIRKIVKQ